MHAADSEPSASERSAAENAPPVPAANQPTGGAPAHAGPPADGTRRPAGPRPVLRAPKAKPGSDRPGEVGEAPAAPDRQAVIARLTARLRLPRAAIDPALLPHELLEPLEKAGLAGPDSLPAAAMTALAMVAPVAGPCVGLAPAEPGSRLGRATGIGLRVCLLVNNRDLPALPPAVAGAAHAVQNALLTRHRAALALSTAQERIAAERRTLYAQAVRAAAALGHAPPPPLPQADLLGPGAPPRILVEDGAGAALVKAAGGGTGVLLVDERRMATLPVGVVGVLTAAECEGLLTATPEMLVGTAFVPAFPPPPGGDPASLADLALRVHALASVDPVMLAFAGAAATALAAAAQRWTADLDRSLQPLSACLAQLPDLAQRLAVALHLVAAAGEGKLAAEIGAGTVRRAVALVETFILPVARTLLSAVSSASAVEADALRLVAALRRHTSLEDPVIDKREWQRATQTTVPSARFKAAVRLLERLALIAPAPPPADRKGGEYFTVARAIHADA